MNATCEAVIDLSNPDRYDGSAHLYTCPSCGAKRRILATSFRGVRRGPHGLAPISAEPGRGGIVCGRPLPQGD